MFQIIALILRLFQFILLARVLLSWIPNLDHSNPAIRLIYDITEPVLRPVREALPQTGMIDFSAMLVFLVITVLLMLLPM